MKKRARPARWSSVIPTAARAGTAPLPHSLGIRCPKSPSPTAAGITYSQHNVSLVMVWYPRGSWRIYPPEGIHMGISRQRFQRPPYGVPFGSRGCERRAGIASSIGLDSSSPTPSARRTDSM